MDNGDIKLADFNLAAIIREELPKKIAGSVLYMEPELFIGSEQDKATDWWAMGIVMWQLWASEEF